MDESEKLGEFFDLIFGSQEGYVYLALKPASKVQVSWRQEFIKWPLERERLVRRVLDQSGRHDVYYSPSLFKTKNATKESAIGANVFWVDFDGNAPQPHLVDPRPTVRVKSSVDGHEHWYWKTDAFISDISVIERVNRNLAYSNKADLSGWDVNQVLRPPFTQNHKRERRTTLAELNDSIYNSEDFGGLNEAPEPQPEPLSNEIPDLHDVIAKYKFEASTWVLFKKGAKDRSDGLMALDYSLAEMNMKNVEIISLLLDADSRWGKFQERTDRIKILNRIVSIARNKFPYNEAIESSRLRAVGFNSLLQAKDIELSWVWEGFLQEAGYLLLTGAPKIGKTQFSLDFGARAVLGQPFLERPCRKELKLGFLSLEMRDSELKLFLQNQAKGLSPEQLKELEERFIMIPVGEPYYLSREQERNDLEEFINENKFDGLIIDSLGSTVEGELTSERDAKAIMDWNDKVRGRHNCFTWFIHHHRKATGDNKKPNGLSDIYGSYIFTARVTTALTLWGTGSTNSINLIPNAVRLAETPKSFPIYRDGNLRFTTNKVGVTIVKKGKEVKEVEVQSDEEFTSGKLSY